MTRKKTNPNFLDLTSYRFESPLGTCFVLISESEPGKIERIELKVGKAGSGLNAMCFAITELATKLVKTGQSITDIIVLLSGIKSDRFRKVRGIEIYTPIDALVLALLQYRSSIPDELEHEQLGKYLRKVR